MLIIDPLSITVIGVCKGRDGIAQGIVLHAGLGNLRASHWLKVHEHLPGSSFEALFFLVPSRSVPVRGRVLSRRVNSVFRECRAHRVFVVSYPFHGSITGCFPLKTQGIPLRFSIPLAGARGSETCRTNKHEVEFQFRNPLPFFILHAEVFKHTTAWSLGFYTSIFIGCNSRFPCLAYVVFCPVENLWKLMSHAVNQTVDGILSVLPRLVSFKIRVNQE